MKINPISEVKQNFIKFDNLVHKKVHKKQLQNKPEIIEDTFIHSPDMPFGEEEWWLQ